MGGMGSVAHLGFFVVWGETIGAWSFVAMFCGGITWGKSKEN